MANKVPNKVTCETQGIPVIQVGNIFAVNQMNQYETLFHKYLMKTQIHKKMSNPRKHFFHPIVSCWGA